ncbi:hypothetical protein [Streptomyces sp. NPDC054784]
MPITGPGHDDPEHDAYDPAWKTQDTPFRRWLHQHMADAGLQEAAAAAAGFAPANRYDGLDDDDITLIADLTGLDYGTVLLAHKADIADWCAEQQLRDHPDLVVVDADLDRIRQRA